MQDWITGNMDRLSKEDRSRNMAAVKHKNTKPEMRVRSAVHRAGFRYSLHSSKLPGKPDLALSKYRTAVFVHGCFWHGHNCRRGRRPTTNVIFWDKKLAQNIARDKKNRKSLQKLGWKVVSIWQCELEQGLEKLLKYLESRRSSIS